ncbi:hypothetical protein BH20ACI2_BH20ACI2_21360 [soil metagenome]
MRRKLDKKPLTPERITTLFNEIAASVGDSLLFLEDKKHKKVKEHLSTIKILKDGVLVDLFHRTTENDLCTITNSSGIKRQWIKFHGEIVVSKPSRETRDTNVSIAVPANGDKSKGLLFAFLPLGREFTGLPFQINADFFPSTERKSLLFDGDYQGDWNRLALTTVGTLFAQNIGNLRDTRTPEDFWMLLNQVWTVDKRFSIGEVNSGSRDEQLAKFWPAIVNGVANFESVLTSRSVWKLPNDVLLFQAPKGTGESILQSVLEALGLDLVHQKLTQFHSVLTSSDIRVQKLKLSNLIAKIKAAGLRHQPLRSAPNWFRESENRTELLNLIEIFRKQEKSTQALNQSLADCPIAINQERDIECPDNLLKLADKNLRKIFLKLGFGYRFIADASHNLILELTNELSLSDAIELLESIDDDKVVSFAGGNPDLFRELVGWLVNNAVVEEEYLKDRLRTLPIWPSSDAFLPLDGLAVPGDFKDPLGLASFVDLEILGLDARTLESIGRNQERFPSTSLNMPKTTLTHAKMFRNKCRKNF